jgi:hypothetical protein
MAWTRHQIEDLMRTRIRDITDEDLNGAEADAVLAVAFYPPLSGDERRIADECWNQIIGARLRAFRCRAEPD